MRIVEIMVGATAVFVENEPGVVTAFGIPGRADVAVFAATVAPQTPSG
jgi:hypothetical protein